MVPGQGATEEHPEERAAEDDRERDQRHCQGTHGLPSSYDRAFDVSGSPPKAETQRTVSICPMCAKSGLMHRSKEHPYSITPLARSGNAGGILNPSAFAVLRFRRRGLYTIRIARAPVRLDPDVTAIGPAQPLERIEERDAGLTLKIGLRVICDQHADAPRLP